MLHIDLNCDVGEGAGNDEQLMPFMTSANIACGYHAGDIRTMEITLQLCRHYGVAAGAHPSFPDRANFGRLEMSCTPAEVYKWVGQQVTELQVLAVKYNIPLVHVKPHGALYNMAARDQGLAAAIAKAVRDINPKMILVGLSGSYLISEAKAVGLFTASEVFADRTYQDDGSLTSRTQPGALIEEESVSIKQVLQMIKKGTVNAVSGKEVPLEAQTVCLHGDGAHAVDFAKTIHETLKREGIIISPLYKNFIPLN